MALPNPDEKGNTGAGTGPLNFTPPTPQNPYPVGSEAYAKWAKANPNSVAPQFDSEGYPLPTAEQIAAFDTTTAFSTGAKPGESAYNPQMGLPEPDSDNPNPPGSDRYNMWRDRNNKKKYNQEAKKAWQQQHADKRQSSEAPAPAAAAAPAQPFASSGIDLTKEGKGESYADSVLQHYNEKGVPTASNEAKTTLDSFRATQPQDMSPYYDYASKLTSAKIDNAMSARGSYGSSNATGQIGAAEMALRAQQAKDTAQYGLDRYAQEGNLAGSSDASSARNNALEFSWAKGLTDLATGAQTAGQDRNQQLFDNNYRVAAAKAGNYFDSTGKAITGVSQATDAANNVSMGNAADQVSGANADANQANADMGSFKDALNQGATNYYNYKTAEDAKDAANKPKAN